MNANELIKAVKLVAKEKNISEDVIFEGLTLALTTAYKKNFNSKTNVIVRIDRESGDIKVYSYLVVVPEIDYGTETEDEEGNIVTTPPEINVDAQILLEDAVKIDPNAKVGDTIEKEVTPKDFGRVAAGTAKQVLTQKIREAERDIIYTEFHDKKGEIVSGIIQKAEGSALVIDLGKVEGIMPIKEQIPTETYRVNDKIRAYVVDVERGLKGNPQVIVSRSHPDFVRRLFEFEIPEIYEGLIEIKNIARDAGSRSKVAVYSTNENIDPVGSCVGQKGVRIQNIINELHGEKIDVIEWNEDPTVFIASALLPAQVLAVDVKDEEKFAQVIVPDDQLSLAIGKSGQNARLSAKLTNWKIDIKSESQFRKMLEESQEIPSEETEEVEETESTDENA